MKKLSVVFIITLALFLVSVGPAKAVQALDSNPYALTTITVSSDQVQRQDGQWWSDLMDVLASLLGS